MSSLAGTQQKARLLPGRGEACSVVLVILVGKRGIREGFRRGAPHNSPVPSRGAQAWTPPPPPVPEPSPALLSTPLQRSPRKAGAFSSGEQTDQQGWKGSLPTSLGQKSLLEGAPASKPALSSKKRVSAHFAEPSPCPRTQLGSGCQAGKVLSSCSPSCLTALRSDQLLQAVSCPTSSSWGQISNCRTPSTCC